MTTDYTKSSRTALVAVARAADTAVSNVSLYQTPCGHYVVHTDDFGALRDALAAAAREPDRVEPCPPVRHEGYIGWRESPPTMQEAMANANDWLWWFVRRDTPGAGGNLRDYLKQYAAEDEARKEGRRK